MGDALDKLELSLRVSGYTRKTKHGIQHVDSYIRSGDAAEDVMRTVSVAAETLKSGDVILDGGRLKQVTRNQRVGSLVGISMRDIQSGENERRTVRVGTLIKKVILGIVAVAVLLGTAAAGYAAAREAPADATTGSSISSTGVAAMHDSTEEKKARVPAPKTLKGYKEMFSKISTNEWGGADVGITFKMKDGRIIWVWADTLSKNNGFVHSTITVQNGGTMTVSNGGKQVLPDGGTDPSDATRKLIYWPDGVKAGPKPNQLLISAMEMSVGTRDAWDFHKTHGDQSRQAIVEIDKAGNAKFVRWVKWIKTPTTGNPHVQNDTKILGPNHYAYGHVLHDIKLQNGKRLAHWSQNWDDGYENHTNPDGSFRYEDWRPIFSAE